AEDGIRDRNVTGVQTCALPILDRATDRVLFTQAYFIPDRELQRALIEAASRGVDVNVLLPENSNHVLVDWLARGQYKVLLRGGEIGRASCRERGSVEGAPRCGV